MDKRLMAFSLLMLVWVGLSALIGGWHMFAPEEWGWLHGTGQLRALAWFGGVPALLLLLLMVVVFGNEGEDD